MPHPESSQPLASQEEELTTSEGENRAIDETAELQETESKSPKKRNWLIPVSAVLLLAVAGGGWGWWQMKQESQSGTNSEMGQPQATLVTVETVTITTLEESSEFVGSLKAPRSVTIQPEIDGRVSEILIQEGAFVNTGTPLIQLNPEKRQADLSSLEQAINVARATRARALSDIKALEAEEDSLQAELNLQQTNYQRISSLVTEGALAQVQLDTVKRDRATAQADLNAIGQRIEAAKASLVEAEARLQQAQANATRAQEELQDATIVAPFAGIVGDIPVKLGEFVSQGDTLTTVTENQTLELELSIPLERATELRLGQTVKGLDSQGETIGIGTISFISPQVNATEQSILAKASFDNSQGQFRDGQFIQAKVIWNEISGISVPTTAVTRIGGETFVYVAEEGEEDSLIASQKIVELGEIQDNNYHVLEGLEPGEELVTTGILNLSDGVTIQVQGLE